MRAATGTGLASQRPAHHYERNRGNSRLDWDSARSATRGAWERAERVLPGDADRDGK